MAKPVRKAVIPVAGLGTRFLPATKAVPKEMLPVVDKPLVQYAVEEGRAAGIEQFLLVTGRGKSAIEDHFDCAPALEQALASAGKADLLAAVTGCRLAPGALSFTRQPEPLGLGHAVWCARHFVGDEPFAVLLPDDLVLAATPCLEQMIAAYGETGGNLVAVAEVPPSRTDRYGVIATGTQRGALVEVTGMVEKPAPADAPSTLSIIGRYILQPELFAHLDRQRQGAGGEIQLTDAMAGMIGGAPFHGFRFAGVRYDCGDRVGFLEASLAFALARADLRDDVIAMLREMTADISAEKD